MIEGSRQLKATPVQVQGSTLPPPVLTYLGDDVWRLESAYTYQDGKYAITVPAGFKFDLSSVPRAFWSVIAPFELSIVAPLLHDFLYECGGDPPPGTVVPAHTYSRREVDDLFRNVMVKENVTPWRRTVAYEAVRLFGGRAFRPR